MNIQLMNRLYLFMSETEISVLSIAITYAVFLVVIFFYFLLVFILHEMKTDYVSKDQKEKTNIQRGIEAFICEYIEPVFADEKVGKRTVKRYRKICSKINDYTPKEKFLNEENKVKPVRLHMRKKYFGPAVMVILEQLLQFRMPENSEEMTMDKIRTIQEMMSRLYECNRNEGEIVEFYYDSGFVQRFCNHIVIEAFFFLECFLAVFMASGFRVPVLYLGALTIFLMILFRARLKKIEINLIDLLACIPYTIIFFMLCIVLEYVGIIPEFFIR